MKIAVMLMAPGGVPAPPEARGREPPFFFFLDIHPRSEKGFPSGPWLPWCGRGESPSEIGSVSLCFSVSAFSDSPPSPFLLYPEIRNSDWGESFTQIFLVKLAFLRQNKSVNRLTGGPRESWARPGGRVRPPVLWPPQTPFRVHSSSGKSQIFQNNSLSVFIPFGLRLILGFCET